MFFLDIELELSTQFSEIGSFIDQFNLLRSGIKIENDVIKVRFYSERSLQFDHEFRRRIKDLNAILVEEGVISQDIYLTSYQYNEALTC